MSETIHEQKSAQRKAGIAARKAIKAPERTAANAAICAQLLALPALWQAQTVLVYSAFGGEVDLAGFIAEAQQHGKTIAYPVCGDGCTLTAAVPGEDGWEVGAYGIRTPILSKAAVLQPEQLDAVLVPCTAFDAGCMRVGMGKGYYDRYLPHCKKAVKIGIAFEAQKVAAAAADEYDQRLDCYVTEKEVYYGA